MNPKAKSYLSLARKARRLEAGEEPVAIACRAQHARLIVVAQDASEHTLRRVRSLVAGTKQPFLQLDCTKDALGDAIGYSACAMAAFTDVRLALCFLQAYDEEGRFLPLQEDLQRRSERVTQRQKEQQAHKKNLRHGKKKHGSDRINS